MRHSRIAIIIVLIASLVVLVSCSSDNSDASSKSACEKSSDVRGNITTVLKAGILIDGTREKQKVNYDKIYAFTNSDTKFFQKQGQQCQPVSYSALRVGQRVQVQSNGVIQQSYPPQLQATEVVILPPEP